jgi:hypothetical protein
MKYVVTIWKAVVGIYHAYLPIEAAKSLFINAYDLVPLRLPKMQDHESLTLHWRSFLWWGREHAVISLAYNGGQCSIYDSLQPLPTQIPNEAKPKIVDALLMPIFMMGQHVCCFLFVLQMGPILHLWRPATIYNTDYQWCKTKHYWCSVDAHFKVLSSQNLLTAIIVFIIISAYELLLGLI